MSTDTISLTFPSASATEDKDFIRWMSGALGELFEAAMKKWDMPAAVIADELFTCLVCASNVQNVDASLLESTGLAQALRKRRKEGQLFDELYQLVLERALPGAAVTHPFGAPVRRHRA